jgi:predicted nucleotidyltransferase
MICDQQHIQSLFAFGSVCSNRFDDTSDIDLLVSFKPLDYGDYADNYFQTADLFEKTFQRPVDLVTDKSLKNPSINQKYCFMDSFLKNAKDGATWEID